MENISLLFMLGWVVGAALVAVVANGRGRGMFVWGAIAVVVGPAFGYLALIALPMRGYAVMGFDSQLHVECKACKGRFRIGAPRCMTCGDTPAPHEVDKVRSASESGCSRKKDA